MNNDELQVLGKSYKPDKHKKWITAFFVGIAALMALVLLGIWLYKPSANAPKNEDKESTIVPELQQAVDSLLNNELERFSDLQGQAIVMEVQTGEILAMAGRERRFDGKFQPCENFAYQQEPGHTMMTAALLALLETGEVKLTDEVDVQNGIWDTGEDYLMKDHNWHRGGYGKITLDRVLEVSSSIGISKTIKKVFSGKELQYYDLLDKMCYGEPASIDGIEGLRQQRFCSPKDSTWARYMLLDNSIGYERLVAPIQTLTFYNAIANDGKMVKPTLYKNKMEVINPQIASKESIVQMQIALKCVVSRGLGKTAGTPLTTVAGKSGTAQVNSIEQSGDGTNTVYEYHLSFCGYFPADAPQYSIIVSLNKQGLPASGSTMAGQVVHDIVEWMMTHDKILERTK